MNTMCIVVKNKNACKESIQAAVLFLHLRVEQ